MEKIIDLHIHTNLSDGALSPKEIIDESSKIGLKTISILAFWSGVIINFHKTKKATGKAASGGIIYFQDNPAEKIINTKIIKKTIALPSSPCITIRRVGIAPCRHKRRKREKVLMWSLTFSK